MPQAARKIEDKQKMSYAHASGAREIKEIKENKPGANCSVNAQQKQRYPSCLSRISFVYLS